MVWFLSWQFGVWDSKPSGTCELWELQDAADVPVWSSICQMRSLQFRYISWGLCKHSRAEIQHCLILWFHLRSFTKYSSTTIESKRQWRGAMKTSTPSHNV
ncbi:unnamed protein product [Linum tenue]|uniref:Uncharacterized protein n=1 Tax=Linum tenue TaxID=586396 RepID=A0AAV0PNN9_9ROSI|nr:unnamed protein product [Linum tenue]